MIKNKEWVEVYICSPLHVFIAWTLFLNWFICIYFLSSSTFYPSFECIAIETACSRLIFQADGIHRAVWHCSKMYSNLQFFSPHTEISRLVLSLNNWCRCLYSVCAVRLAAVELRWMRSFGSQGQASYVNQFGFDDVALLCCVLPCTGKPTLRIKLKFKLCVFNTNWLCPSAVLVASHNHTDTVIILLTLRRLTTYIYIYVVPHR
jgi:hypothetical protein